MRGVAGKKHMALTVALGNEKMLLPRSRPLYFDVDIVQAGDAFEVSRRIVARFEKCAYGEVLGVVFVQDDRRVFIVAT